METFEGLTPDTLFAVFRGFRCGHYVCKVARKCEPGSEFAVLREILPHAAAALTFRVPPSAFLDGGNERGQSARRDRLAINTLHDALSAQRGRYYCPTVLLPAQIADQRKSWFNDRGRASTAICATACRQNGLGLGAIFCQTF